MSPIKVLQVASIEKEAFFFNNLVDLSDPHEVTYSFANFAPETEFARSMRSRGARVHSLRPFGMTGIPLAMLSLWRVLKEEDPDIVHTHLFNPTFVGLLAAKLQGRKTVLTRHHSDAVHLLPSRIKRSLYLWVERQNNRRADHIIALSRMVRECVVEWEGTPAEKVTIIPNPQTTDRYDKITNSVIADKRAELGMDRQLSLVNVSRLFDRKGHRYLFEAIAPLLKAGLKAKLYLVGTGDYRQQLEGMASAMGIQSDVEFLGWRDDALAIIGAADVIVHPSLEDALSQCLIESLMLGKPIIATDISGATDILDGGRYGRLIPPADAEALHTALEEVIAALPAAKARAQNGREYLLDYMDARRVCDEHIEIYERVLNECRSSN